MVAQENKLEWVQALRGAAAFMVVMVHSRSVLMDTASGKVVADHVLLPLGMGVDLFFIISGFLMMFTTRNFDGSKAYAWRFIAKRASRIWPLFAVVTPVALLVEHGVHGFFDPSVVLPYLEGLAFIPHNPGASGIYFQMAAGVAWTLCFECYFYMLFAACMLFGRWRYVVMTAWFVLTLVAIPLLRGNYSLNVASQPLVEWCRYANLAINPIVWDFIIGMIAGWLYVADFKFRRVWVIYAAVVVSTMLLLIGWHRIGLVNFFGPRGWALPMAILFFGVGMLAKVGAINVPSWSVWLGNISYSLYLVHVYVFEVAQRVIGAIPIAHEVSNALLFITRPALAVIVAWLTFRYVEAPISSWARKGLLRIRMPARSRTLERAC
ncbi:acyltransferase [Dyella dinghuensis]|uniref:Acyltransferase n=1 Tax=Dyella dinghuensis TaxID=1920169 RepID=A0A3S0RDX0_9GAMM|nr:acyltransferase [Dyella dinghuensis]RUL63445.1 acyltransferase [Dyella dinghuensis]